MAGAQSVLNGTALRLVLSHRIQMRMSDLTGKQLFSVPVLRVSYVRCRSWRAVFAAFRCPALGTTRGPEAIRGAGD